MNVDQALDRLRELTQPHSRGCLWPTAMWRLTLIDMAKTPLAGRVTWLEDSAIAAEVRALQADHPNAHVCCEHRAKMAEIEGGAAR